MATAQKPFSAEIAGIIYSIKPVFSSTCYFCKDYLADGKPDIYIEITEDDINREIERGKVYFFTCEEFVGGAEDKRVFSRAINKNCIETVVLHQKVIETSLDFGVFFMHGAAIAVNQKAIMFTAPSGTGKTTHIMKWIRKVNNSSVINGDKPLIRLSDSQAIVCGTPWCGKEDMGENLKVPLDAIVIMVRSDSNEINEISFGEAYPFLLQQTYLPFAADKAKRTLQLLEQLGNKAHFYKFHFNNFQDDCFDVAYKALAGDGK